MGRVLISQLQRGTIRTSRVALQLDEKQMAKTVGYIAEQRGAVRDPVTMVGQLGGKQGDRVGTILNVSNEGFCARLQHELPFGSRVELNCAGYAGVSATVVWRKGSDHGFQFAEGHAIKPAAVDDGAPTVIWVDFHALAIVDGPLFPSATRKYPGFVRLSLALVLGSGAWMLMAAIAFGLAGLAR